MAAGAWAQDIAKVPIKVNVNASVSAVPDVTSGFETVNINVTANVTDTLRLPLIKPSGVSYFGAQRHTNAPSIVGRGGNITVNLPAQSYNSADVALYTANGKRILSGRVSSSNAVNNISRRNIATGVYLLSVRGADGEAVTERITHSGGGLNINAAFTGGSGNIADARKTAKKAADEQRWDIKVSADGFIDSAFTVRVAAGNNPLQNIILRGTSSGGGTYEFVTIGGMKWMKRNLNIETAESWCYGEGGQVYDDDIRDYVTLTPSQIQANCNTYGRLYTWNAAKTACPTGWHLPTREEWGALAKAAGGMETYGDGGGAGMALRSTDGWNYNRNGTDEFGFSALPVGSRYNGNFKDAGFTCDWWTATEYDWSNAYVRGMKYIFDDLFEGYISKDEESSVRCVKD